MKALGQRAVSSCPGPGSRRREDSGRIRNGKTRNIYNFSWSVFNAEGSVAVYILIKRNNPFIRAPSLHSQLSPPVGEGDWPMSRGCHGNTPPRAAVSACGSGWVDSTAQHARSSSLECQAAVGWWKGKATPPLTHTPEGSGSQ